MASLIDGVSGLIAKEESNGVQSPLMLISMMIDDSTSMSFCNNFQVVMEGHNGVLNTLAASPQAPLFLARTQYMHGKALANGYRPLSRVPRMTAKNYRLIGGTPLYVATHRVLWYVKRRAKEYAEQGNDVRTLTLLLTDGDNRDRRNLAADDARHIIEPMIATEKHIVAGVGVASPYADFRTVFLQMGIPEQWILTLRSPDEIRAMFGTFSSLAEKSSVSQRNFTETQMTGFSNKDTKVG